MPRFLRGNSLLWIARQSMNQFRQGVKLFTPCDDAQNNDYGKNRCGNQAALHINVVKKGVDFFHNLNFCFQKWFRSGFQGAEIA